ncbi:MULTISPECIES: lytic murein transglycosylase B [unclassified Modicisalibacter]|uniref:lytic murein transglycosylase B n=1 Tax=unclassified Modicisalibacter TaxID=2679913 RepID=UPI001CCE0306|nr:MULTISPECIES: lytic murein transglycosylase B [unclassified Modicisalibacter]
MGFPARQPSRFRLGLLGCIMALGTTSAWADSAFDPASHPDVAAWVDARVAAGTDRDWLVKALDEAGYSQDVLDAMARAPEHRMTWGEYRDIFIQPERVEAGAAFIEAHRDAFARARAQYGVAPEVIAAIIGVETYYGRHTGTHRVLDSLATLAFHHPSRGDFFRGELAAFIDLTREQGIDPATLEGSYAGAMGYPQFIPTSYQAYAVDFDADGKRDLWHDPVDAIGSVGNYFARHGWQAGGAVVSAASGPATPPDGVTFNQAREPYVRIDALAAKGITPAGSTGLDGAQRVVPLALEGDDGRVDYRLGHENFYVITRYNHSYLYAMAVTTLADRIRDAREASS